MDKIILQMVSSYILAKMCYLTQMSRNAELEDNADNVFYYSAQHDILEDVFREINRWLDA